MKIFLSRWFLPAIALFTSLQGCAGESAFIATPPYYPSVSGRSNYFDLANISRTFDFGGDEQFFNSRTGAPDFATVNAWDAVQDRAMVITSNRFAREGVPGRVFKTSDYTAIGYVKGDGVVEGTLRTQLNSFPISTRKPVIWKLKFRLGGNSLEMPWFITPHGFAPATLWQLKTVGLPPALVMAVDTDPTDSAKLKFVFDIRISPDKPASRLGDISGIHPARENYVRIESFLDDRPFSQGGMGFLRIFFNDQLIVVHRGPNVQAAAIDPYHWSLAMYLYANTAPLPFDRFVFWKQAKMISPEFIPN